MKRIFAVFGNPILHSKSPMIHNSLFAHTHIDACYTRIRVDSCEEVISTIRSLGIIGANITTPFKECLLPLLDWLSPEVEQIGAVNTIINDNGYLKGYNTDSLGVIKSIEETEIDVFGKRFLVLGAGGASRAAVFGLIKAGGEVFIANRTHSKAVDISNQMGCNVIQMDEINEMISTIDVVVSTLLPNVSLPSFDWKSGVQLFVDANYRKSKLSDEARRSGVPVVHGDRWLLHQALGAFSLFTGFESHIELLEGAILQSLDFNNIKYKAIDLVNNDCLGDEKFDLLVLSGGKTPEEVNRIIDEEKHKAING